MNIPTLIIGALVTPALPAERHDFQATGHALESAPVPVLQAGKCCPTSTPASPAPKPTRKEREPRPAVPAHLFM